MNRPNLFAAIAALATLACPMIASAELVLWLDFENNINDQSGNGLTTGGTAPTYSGDVPTAIGSGTSGDFDGLTHQIDISANALLDSSVFTLTYFIQPDAQDGPFERITSRSGNEFETGLGTGGPAALSYYNEGGAGGWHNPGSTTVATDGSTWTHVAWQNTGGATNLFINGTLVASGPASIIDPTGTTMHVGDHATVAEAYNGRIDDLALFSEALSAAEIQSIATGGVAGLVADPSFAEVGSSIGIDFAGQSGVMGGSEVAGVVQQDNWTTLAGTGFNLVDNTGVSTTLNVTAVAPGNTFGPTNNATFAGDDAVLMDDGLYVNGTNLNASNGPSATIDIAEVPYETYDVIVYLGGNDPDPVVAGSVTLSNSADTFFYESAILSDYVQATATDAAGAFNSNYALFTGLTGDSFTITATLTDAVANQLFVTGIQIIEATASTIPAPSALPAGLALAALFASRRRR